MGTWPNEPRWTVQLYLWIDLSAKNLWHWNFNSNGAAKEWRNGPGSQWISGWLLEFKLPTDSPFDYIHHVTSCYIQVTSIVIIYIWSIFYLYMCILFLSMYILPVFLHPSNQPLQSFAELTKRRQGTARSLGLVSWPPRGQRPIFLPLDAHWMPIGLLCKDHWFHWFTVSGSFKDIFGYIFLGSFWSHSAQWSSMIFNCYLVLFVATFGTKNITPCQKHIRNPRLKKKQTRSPALNCQGNLRSSLITSSLTVIRCRPRLSKDMYKH